MHALIGTELSVARAEELRGDAHRRHARTRRVRRVRNPAPSTASR